MQSWKDKFVAEIDDAIAELKVAKARYEQGKAAVYVFASLNAAKKRINKSILTLISKRIP